MPEILQQQRAEIDKLADQYRKRLGTPWMAGAKIKAKFCLTPQQATQHYNEMIQQIHFKMPKEIIAKPEVFS